MAARFLLAIAALCLSGAIHATTVGADAGRPCGPAPPLPPLVCFLLPVFCDGPIGVLADSPINPESGCAADGTPRGTTLRTFFHGHTHTAQPHTHTHTAVTHVAAAEHTYILLTQRLPLSTFCLCV